MENSKPSLVALLVKNLPAMWETWVQSLGWEDLLEKGMATHSSILAWRIPWTEEPGRLQSIGSQRVIHDSTTSTVIWGWPCSREGCQNSLGCCAGIWGLIYMQWSHWCHPYILVAFFIVKKLWAEPRVAEHRNCSEMPSNEILEAKKFFLHSLNL